jgi:hypothetical protein
MERSKAVEYGTLFVSNGLTASDIPQFDHDLLKSMDINLAKDRLLYLLFEKFDKDRLKILEVVKHIKQQVLFGVLFSYKLS